MAGPALDTHRPASPVTTPARHTALAVAASRCHAGHVNAVVVEVARRADGKLYPPRPLTHAERNWARWLVHNLVHRDGLSIREAQRVMLGQYGVRRSLGMVNIFVVWPNSISSPRYMKAVKSDTRAACCMLWVTITIV